MRRDFLKALRPGRPRPGRSVPLPRGRAPREDEGRAYDGPYYVVFNASGGWDTTYLMDPKGINGINRLYKEGDILTQGAHKFAPTGSTPRAGMSNEDFYAEFGNELLAFNGLDYSVNNHSPGARYMATGKLDSLAYPTFAALVAACQGPACPLSFLTFGNYSATGNLVAMSRVPYLPSLQEDRQRRRGRGQRPRRRITTASPSTASRPRSATHTRPTLASRGSRGRKPLPSPVPIEPIATPATSSRPAAKRTPPNGLRLTPSTDAWVSLRAKASTAPTRASSRPTPIVNFGPTADFSARLAAASACSAASLAFLASSSGVSGMARQPHDLAGEHVVGGAAGVGPHLLRSILTTQTFFRRAQRASESGSSSSVRTRARNSAPSAP